MIGEAKARDIARRYGSDTNIGHVMHAFGAGNDVDPEALWLDADTYLHNLFPTDPARTELQALQTWADSVPREEDSPIQAE